MIEIGVGNIFDADVDAVINPVNCVGVMGKGLALQFKLRFPPNFKAYADACRTRDITPGEMFIFDNGGLLRPRFIVNFPTKRDWRDKSRIDDIRTGLEALTGDVDRLKIR